MNAVDDAEKMLFLVFSPDSTQVELFFSEEEMPNEILERRGLPAGGYVWNVEDDDTKNVRLEDGRWTVSYTHLDVYKRQISGTSRNAIRDSALCSSFRMASMSPCPLSYSRPP